MKLKTYMNLKSYLFVCDNDIELGQNDIVNCDKISRIYEKYVKC